MNKWSNNAGSHNTMIKAPEIDFYNIRATYAQQPLFDNLSLILPGGQCTCLLGPSGCGKSSLLRLIAGLDIGSSDSHLEYKTDDGEPLQGRIACISQQDALLPWLNAMENVFFCRLLLNQPVNAEDKTRTLQLLQMVGLENAADKKPAQLSGGMRQRVALARLLFEDKPVILLDEPFAAVDAITRWRLQELTINLLKNRTLLWITHDPIEALRVAQHIKIMGQQPAHWIKDFTFPPPTPREIDHPDFIDWHRQLIDGLQQALTKEGTA